MLPGYGARPITVPPQIPESRLWFGEEKLVGSNLNQKDPGFV